ncbi:MAG: discoidin domain-containing protein, partial [Sphingomonadaceae bacterium]
TATPTPTATPTETPLPATETPTATPTATETPTATPTATQDTKVNLALNRPVAVSSYLDWAHAGARAVDGSSATYWQTKPVTGPGGPTTESIRVDLGSNRTIGEVVLEWDANYATSYTIQVSTNNFDWTTLFTTTTGDGGIDTIPFTPTVARWVRMESTAWSDSSLRNWLREFRVMSGG